MDIKHNIPDIGEVKNEQDSVSPEVSKFFYLSFRFSQGSDVLQKHIFKWAAANDLFGKIPEKIPKNILDKLKIPDAHEYVGTGRAEFENQWNVMSGVFTEKVKDPAGSVVSSITAGIIGRDVRYIKAGRDRLAVGLNSNSNLQERANMSFIRKYVFLKEKTGNLYFDKMFEEISLKINQNNGRNVFDGLVGELSTVWEATHPGQKFYSNL